MTKRKTPRPAKIDGAMECIELCAEGKTFVEENGVRATFLKPRRKAVRKIRYDRCYCERRDTKQADYIIGVVGLVDVITELKGSDTNLKGSDGRSAANQVESTLIDWRNDPLAARRIAALIVYGRIEGKKKGAGRRPRARSTVQSLEAYFLRKFEVLLLVRESGEVHFKFSDFLPRSSAK
jgi:hypothetical protein